MAEQVPNLRVIVGDTASEGVTDQNHLPLTQVEHRQITSTLANWRQSIDHPETTSPIELHSADVALLERMAVTYNLHNPTTSQQPQWSDPTYRRQIFQAIYGLPYEQRVVYPSEPDEVLAAWPYLYGEPHSKTIRPLGSSRTADLGLREKSLMAEQALAPRPVSQQFMEKILADRHGNEARLRYLVAADNLTALSVLRKEIVRVLVASKHADLLPLSGIGRTMELAGGIALHFHTLAYCSHSLDGLNVDGALVRPGSNGPEPDWNQIQGCLYGAKGWLLVDSDRPETPPVGITNRRR